VSYRHKVLRSSGMLRSFFLGGGVTDLSEQSSCCPNFKGPNQRKLHTRARRPQASTAPRRKPSHPLPGLCLKIWALWIATFWNAKVCRLLEVYQHFSEFCCLHEHAFAVLQGSHPRQFFSSMSWEKKTLCIYDMIYLLTAIGLSLGGSTHLHTNNTTQITTNVEKCGPCPLFASFTLAFALQLRKKHGKTSVRVRKTSVRLRKTSVGLRKTSARLRKNSVRLRKNSG